jgi:predicted membrane protein
MKKLNSNFIFGIFFIVLGIVICLKYLGVILNIDYSVIVWSFVCLAGLVMVINDKKFSVFPSLLIVIGLWNTLKEANIINYSIFHFIWPICLITIGLSLIFSNKLFSKRNNLKIKNDGSTLVFNGIFSGIEQRLSTNPFKGLNATALFGGVDLDLRDVVIVDKEVVIDVSAFFGGVTIIMPDNKYNVVVDDSIAMFGGVDNKYKGIFEEGKNTIYVNCRAIFGGVEMK